MGDTDKLENLGQEKLGEAKEAFGKASDDDDLEAEGKADQMKGSLKQAGEKVKDAFS
ncbi:CsbD family protein [Nocardioides montaniterrae]